MTDLIEGLRATPLLELARSVPKDLRAEWETQWRPDGTPCGHAMAPVGKYIHDMADRIDELEAEVERLRETGQKIWDDWNVIRKENQALREVVEAMRRALEQIKDEVAGNFDACAYNIAKDALDKDEL